MTEKDTLVLETWVPGHTDMIGTITKVFQDRKGHFGARKTNTWDIDMSRNMIKYLQERKGHYTFFNLFVIESI